MGDHGHQHVLDAFVVQRSGEMMVVDDVMPLLRAEDDRDRVPAEKLGAFLPLVLAPALSFLVDLAHAHGDLGGAQARNRHRMENRLAYDNHGCLPG